MQLYTLVCDLPLNQRRRRRSQKTSANRYYGFRSGSSSGHESGCLQPLAVYILLYLGHHPAFRGQRSPTAQVFSSSRVLSHSAWHRSSSTAPLYRGLHCSHHVEESQTKESGLISGCWWI